jgi:hypothetical protein
MLIELEMMHRVLEGQPQQEAELLASSIDSLIEELRVSFQEDLAYSYHRLPPARKETYNAVALLIVDMRIMMKALMQRQRERSRRVQLTA